MSYLCVLEIFEVPSRPLALPGWLLATFALFMSGIFL